MTPNGTDELFKQFVRWVGHSEAIRLTRDRQIGLVPPEKIPSGLPGSTMERLLAVVEGKVALAVVTPSVTHTSLERPGMKDHACGAYHARIAPLMS